MKITIQFQTPTLAHRGGRQYHAVKGTATGTDGIDSNIFLYRLGVTGTLRAADTFVTVASAAQMEDVPAGKEGLDQVTAQELPVYYRTSEFEFLHRHEGEVLRVMDMILEDAGELMRDFYAAQALQVETTYELTPEGTTKL